MIGLILICLVRPSVASLNVTVEGVSSDLRKNVLARLTVQRERDRADLSEIQVRRYIQHGLTETHQALEPFGYYNPRIQSELQKTTDGWRIRFVIDPGEAVLFNDFEVRILGPGSADDALVALASKRDIRHGDPALHERYEEYKARLQQRAVERGYLDAEYLRHELRVDTKAFTADVILHLETGPQYRFGEVSFDDAELERELLIRYSAISPGQVYSNASLLDFQRALEASGYYERVDVVPLRDQAKNHVVPIHVTLTPRLKHLYSAGIGFGTDTGVRGQLGWENRRVNQYGHRMNAGIRASDILQAVTVHYTIPLTNPRSDRLEFTAGLVEEQSDTVDSSVQKVGVSRSKERERWRDTLSLFHHREKFELGLTEGTTSLLMPGLSIGYVQADNRLLARRGHALQFDLRGAAEQLLSDMSFAQAGIKAKLIHALGKRGRLIARAEGGSTWTDRFDELPATLRYYAGGDQSVRGYGFEELGPKDASGEVVGGKHLVFGSLEYQHRVHGDWGVAAFIDTGNAFNNVAEGLETGAGIGLRWQSPVGMVRVDLASAISDDNGLRLHITLGPDL